MIEESIERGRGIEEKIMQYFAIWYICVMFLIYIIQESNMKKLLVASALLLLSVAPAMANNYYGKGTIGIFSPDESGLDSTVSLYGAIGTSLKEQFNAPVSAELGIGYASPSERFVDVTIIPVTVTALYEIPLRDPRFALNVGGGLGLYFWDVEVDNGFFGGFEDDGVELGLHLQAGLDYKLNKQTSLVGELKWSAAEADDVEIGGVSANVGAKINF
jgi:hypothetical protein